jgi:hypothetical protein
MDNAVGDVRAYKFLRPGAVGPFSHVPWPQPARDLPGAWVRGRPNACVSGVHGCTVADLPYWLCEELWEVELADVVERAGRKLIARRGRLVRRVVEWDGGLEAATVFAERASERAQRCPAVEAYARDAEALAPRPGVAGAVALVAVVAAIGEDGPEAREAERAWQAAWLAERYQLRDA